MDDQPKSPGSPGTHHHHLHIPHHHTLRKTGQRLKHLIHPDGRKVHIAQNPAEAEELKRTLSSDSDDDIEIFIHGSDEHLEALRTIRDHNDQRRNELRARYGHIFEQAEAVSLELEALSEELRSLTDRSVQFDANFNRYGYNATIRTHGNASQPHSSAVSLVSGKTNQQALDDFHALKHQGQAMKVWRKPILRQYFHQGLLWRAQEEEQTASYELFLDLVYVGIIAISGDNAAEHPNGSSLLRFGISFIMGWKIWFDLVQIMNWFDQDDVWRRVFVLWEIACLVGFTTNIAEYEEVTYAPLVGFYLAARLASALYLAWMGWLIPMIRYPMAAMVLTVLLPVALWIGSIHLAEPARLGLIWTAIVLDLFGFSLTIQLRFLASLTPTSSFSQWLSKAFAFFPANNIEHRIDRQGAFVTLVLGYSVVSLLYNSASHLGVNAFLGKAILGLVQAFALNTLYFEVDSFNMHSHAIRRSAVSALSWMTLHLPMILSFVLAGAALSRLVITADVEGSSSEELAEASALKSEGEVSAGLRWFYCAGLGIGLLCLNGIAFCHKYRTVALAPGTVFPPLFKRRNRLIYRSAVGLVVVFLGFVESLSSLQLIALTTGLILSTAFFELLGNMITGCQKHLRRRRSDLSGTSEGGMSGSTLRDGDCPKIRLKDWWRAIKEEHCREGKCHYRARVRERKGDIEDIGDGRATIKIEELERKKPAAVDGEVAGEAFQRHSERQQAFCI